MHLSSLTPVNGYAFVYSCVSLWNGTWHLRSRSGQVRVTCGFCRACLRGCATCVRVQSVWAWAVKHLYFLISAFSVSCHLPDSPSDPEPEERATSAIRGVTHLYFTPITSRFFLCGGRKTKHSQVELFFLRSRITSVQAELYPDTPLQRVTITPLSSFLRVAQRDRNSSPISPHFSGSKSRASFFSAHNQLHHSNVIEPRLRSSISHPDCLCTWCWICGCVLSG